MTIGNDDAKVKQRARRRRRLFPKFPNEALHVNAYEDRHGKVRRYFRIGGRKVVKIPGEPGSIEYTKAWLAAMETLPIREIGKTKRSKAGSVSEAIAGYFTSNQYFLEPLSAGTQRGRKGILNRFREQGRDGDKPIASLRRSDIITRLDKVAPSTRRNVLVALRGLMEYAVAMEWVKEDPTAGIKGYKAPAKTGGGGEEDGRQTWPEQWIAQYEAHHPIGSTARLAMALPLFTAQRRSDVVRMGPGMFNKNNIIVLRQKKTGTMVYCPIEPERYQPNSQLSRDRLRDFIIFLRRPPYGGCTRRPQGPLPGGGLRPPAPQGRGETRPALTWYLRGPEDNLLRRLVFPIIRS